MGGNERNNRMIPKKSAKVNIEELVELALESFEEVDYTLRWKLPFLTAQRLKGACLNLSGGIPKTLPKPILDYIIDHSYKFQMPPDMDAEDFALAVHMDWNKVNTPHGHNPFTLAARQAETSGITYFLPPNLFPIPRIQEHAQKLINVLYCLAQNSQDGEFYIASRTAAQFLGIDQKAALRIINYLSQYQILTKTRQVRIGKGIIYCYRFAPRK
jgi:hypothetical protein